MVPPGTAIAVVPASGGSPKAGAHTAHTGTAVKQVHSGLIRVHGGLADACSARCAVFAKYNPVTAMIQLDKLTQKPRGFGFVMFRDRESMLDSVRDMHNKDIDGRPISVKEAIPQDQIKPGTPAAAIGRGGYDRRDGDRRYDRYPDRRGYESRGGNYGG